MNPRTFLMILFIIAWSFLITGPLIAVAKLEELSFAWWLLIVTSSAIASLSGQRLFNKREVSE